MKFSADEDFALRLDAEDPLRHFREKFHLPLGKDGKPVIYFAGNSLGLMPKSARQIVEEELDNWATLGVDAHHATGTPWYSYHEALREPTARLIGAKPLEVICMNSLTVNLHLMMATFYRPTKSRFKILMEEPAFPSDTYAIKTQIMHHGLDPQDGLILTRPRKGEFTIRTEDILDLIDKNADQLAIVIFGGANFFTGQLSTSRRSPRQRTSTESSRGSILRTRSATSRSRFTIGMSISLSGVPTNISMPAPAQSQAHSCTSVMRLTLACYVSLAGSGTIRIPDSAYTSSRTSSQFLRLMDGRSATRQFSQWRRCARRWRSLMKLGEWSDFAANRSSSPAISNF